jgi:P27 family predicted phage terminase small subunit
MGRARQPVNLLVYKGNKNLTKKEIEERSSLEVKAPADNIKPPSNLPRELKKEFKKISNELMRIGIMTNLDVDALARFLIAQKLYWEITDTVMRLPHTIEVPSWKKDKHGESYQDGMKEVANPAYTDTLKNQNTLFKQCQASASDLGLTISSRCRLVMPKSEEKPKTEAQKRFGDRL